MVSPRRCCRPSRLTLWPSSKQPWPARPKPDGTRWRPWPVDRRSRSARGSSLGQLADDDVVAYACFRVGYHRGRRATGERLARFRFRSLRSPIRTAVSSPASTDCGPQRVPLARLRRSGGVRSSSPSSTRHGRSTDSRARPVDACVRWPRVAGGGGCLGPGGPALSYWWPSDPVLWSGCASPEETGQQAGHQLAECFLWWTSHRTGVRRQPQRDLRAGPQQHVGRRALGLCGADHRRADRHREFAHPGLGIDRRPQQRLRGCGGGRDRLLQRRRQERERFDPLGPRTGPSFPGSATCVARIEFLTGHVPSTSTTAPTDVGGDPLRGRLTGESERRATHRTGRAGTVRPRSRRVRPSSATRALVAADRPLRGGSRARLIDGT